MCIFPRACTRGYRVCWVRQDDDLHFMSEEMADFVLAS